MAFKIEHTGEGEFITIQLLNEATGAYIEVFIRGALLNKYVIPFDHQYFNCIDGYDNVQNAKATITEAFKSAKLSPFVCRLNNGTFSFNDEEYQVGKHFDGKSAIHGLVFDEVFKIQDSIISDEFASITLTKEVRADQYGFPFHYCLTIIYTLKCNNAVQIETIVKNEGTMTMPLSDGWHPYFKLDDVVDETLLQFRSKQMAIFDAYLLPTGVFQDYNQFADYQRIGSIELDNSFTIDQLEAPALHLKSTANNLQLSVSPKKGYPILQLYIPPTRKSIAVENLTSLPDSFNNHIGLLTLNPHETKHFITEYHLQEIL